MENDIATDTEKKPSEDGMVHFILSHSYTVFLFAVVLGVVFDVFLPFNIFSENKYQYLGMAMIFLGSILIYWAQSTSSSTKKALEKDGEQRNFACGPYKYSRNPTHIGLSVMTLGLAFVINSLFSVIFVVIASLITKLVFVKKEEMILEKKYGEAYCEYKKKVNTWI
jgi:protein-S-isoprenylcysteine O-methyltransferase Ste14